jgi:xanthine phosphoribosyltransferase
MNKVYYTDKHIRSCVHSIIREMHNQNWRPDYVVGLTRGGLVPAVMISQYIGCRMETLNVSLRDTTSGPESNLWMAEDAYGYIPTDERTNNIGALPVTEHTSDTTKRKNILVVDDINDTGATLDWIKQDWMSGCLPSDHHWNEIWNQNVRFAVLVNNEASNFKDVDYVGASINKLDNPSWIVFPWENWWEE